MSKLELFRLGFAHRLSGVIPPIELAAALQHGFYQYMRGWQYARKLFPGID